MATATTFTSTEDLCSRWQSLSNEDLTADEVEHILRCIPDDLWVAAACADRVLEDAAVQRPILELGIEKTQSALERSRIAHTIIKDENKDEGEEEPLENTAVQVHTGSAAPQSQHAALVAHFCAEPADAQLCHIRAVLLDRLDRLNTFVEMHKEVSVEGDNSEDVDDEWEDDPWAEGDATSRATKTEDPVLPLSTVLTADLLHLACLLASSDQFGPLRILVEKHGPVLWPYRFLILDSIAEHVLVTRLKDTLPIYDISEDREKTVSYKPWRHELDFTETAHLQAAILDAKGPLLLNIPQQCMEGFTPRPDPLSSAELAEWYRDRIERIITETGMVDVAFLMVQHAASQGLPGLDEDGEDLSLLSRLVYDAPASPNTPEDLTVTQWRAMAPSAVVRAYLEHSTPEIVARDISKLVMPYLFVLESRAERVGHPDPSLPNRLLYEYILNAPLLIASAIFEASKPTLSSGQRLVRNDEDLAKLALARLYGSDSLDEWPVMSHIFECLPAWDNAGDDDEADEADTTIASLGAFVTPSAVRPRCTPADLLVFFNPLPSSSLSRLLDVLDVHLESGEILARWGVPAPLRWFLQSNGKITEQRSWANRMARRAGGPEGKLETQADWEWLLEDMLKLSDSGDSGSWSAFCLLSKDDLVRIFFGGLLSTGRFGIAKALLRSRNVHLSLDPPVIEDMCLTCSQEFYDNASSGNYHFGEMKLAYDCLDIPPASERIIREKEFIEATSRLCSFNLVSRPGIPITPLEIRLTKDRLSLVSRVLSSNPEAYKHTQVILELVHKLGFRGDVVAEVKTLAMLVETALQAEDFTRAYETSEKMVDAVLKLRSTSSVADASAQEASEVCWVACFQLGRHPEFEDIPKKLTLLGRALELCPADRLVDVLNVWRPLEGQDLEERQDRIASHRIRARTAELRAASAHDPIASLAARLPQLRMPDLHISHSPLANAPDAAALANKAFNRVTATFPFSVGGRGHHPMSEAGDSFGTRRDSSRTRVEGVDVSAQASRVLQAGIGWLLGGDEET